MKLLILINTDGRFIGINVNHITSIRDATDNSKEGGRPKIVIRVDTEVHTVYMTFKRLLEDIHKAKDI